MTNAHEDRQETLFISNEQFGLIQPRAFDERTPNVPVNNRIEQKIHLMNSLGYLAAAKLRSGTIQQGPDSELAERYGSGTPDVVAGAARNMTHFKHLAYEEFEAAVAKPTLDAAKQFKRGQSKSIVGEMYAKFFSKFYSSPESFKESAAYRKKLDAEVRTLQEQQTLFNREHGLRWDDMPIKKNLGDDQQVVVAEEAVATEQMEPRDESLDTRSRMLAIRRDMRAGFLPRSNGEKNMVITYLDYLDNPNYPFKIVDQMMEVWNHTQKLHLGISTARRTMESLVWQMADYYDDARTSLGDLESLATLVEDARPSLKLAELDDVGVDHPGILRLVRGVDIESYVRTGNVVEAVSDPLAGTEQRVVPKGDRSSGRHKYIRDQYTRPDRAEKNPDLEAYLQEQAATLTVKDVRRELPAVLETERRRSDFMRRRLEDTLQLDGKRQFMDAVNVAKSSLGLTDQAA